jgi:hypothetical protein
LKNLSGIVLAAFYLFCTGLSDGCAQTGSSKDSPFGFTTSFYAPKRPSAKELEEIRKNKKYLGAPADNPAYSTAVDMGVRWERPPHPVLDWSFVQRDFDSIKNGVYNWSVPDNFLKHIPAELNLVVTLAVGDKALIPGTWKFRSPQAKAAFRDFIRRAVERYNGDGVNDMPGLKSPVKFWQVENEPETHIVRNIPGKPKPNLDWQGYSDFLRLSYGEIKAVDSGAQVLCAGTLSPHDQIIKPIIDEFWIPLIRELKGEYMDVFDFHWFGPNYKDSYNFYKKIRGELDKNGFSRTEFWMTETGFSSRYGEKDQAIEIVKRFVYPLSYGVKKIFWAWALVEGWPPFNCESMFDYTGLIYDGACDEDPGYGVKKLGYYTYRLLTHKLAWTSGSTLERVETDNNNVNVFKFSGTSGPVYVLWYDSQDPKASIPYELRGMDNVGYVVTEAVPSASKGENIRSYRSDIFKTSTMTARKGSLLLKLGQVPVYVEPASNNTSKYWLGTVKPH